MNSKIAIYDDHEKAVNAIKILGENDFPMGKVSLIGKAEVIDNHIHVQSLKSAKNAPAIIGAGAGLLVGALSGLGVFVIPGFGFLYGAGAIIGAIGGFDIGVITGGITSLLAEIGIKKDKIVTYQEHLNEGKFMIVIDGTDEEVAKAENILHTEGTHLSID